MYPIKEVSALQKVGEKWLYVKGDVSRPSPEQTEKMTKTWPEMVGVELKPIEETLSKAPSGVNLASRGSNPFLEQSGFKGGMKSSAKNSKLGAVGTSNTKKGTKKV